MGNHPAISALLAGAMITVALYCVARLVLSLNANIITERTTDAVHGVMGISMAGMLVPSLSGVPDDVWIALFVGSALWFGWKLLQDSGSARRPPFESHLPHFLMCIAMIYMLVVMDWVGSGQSSHAASMAMSGPHTGEAPWPILAGFLTVILVGDVAINAGLTLRRTTPANAMERPQLAMSESRPNSERITGAGVVGVGEGVKTDVGGEQCETGRRPGVLAPRSAVLCQLVMCLVMGYMLVTLS
jgi:MFS family permease